MFFVILSEVVHGDDGRLKLGQSLELNPRPQRAAPCLRPHALLPLLQQTFSTPAASQATSPQASRHYGGRPPSQQPARKRDREDDDARNIVCEACGHIQRRRLERDLPLRQSPMSQEVDEEDDAVSTYRNPLLQTTTSPCSSAWQGDDPHTEA